ncbi:MAG: hypothetical protein VST71_04695 [Nitrospirota bacterium]|nr:hypothetical protein [Nitrospirota bacterium]
MEVILSGGYLREGITRHKNVCPYNHGSVCVASISSFLIGHQRKADCCETEEYDNCPMFLSKILRKG